MANTEAIKSDLTIGFLKSADRDKLGSIPIKEGNVIFSEGHNQEFADYSGTRHTIDSIINTHEVGGAWYNLAELRSSDINMDSVTKYANSGKMLLTSDGYTFVAKTSSFCALCGFDANAIPSKMYDGHYGYIISSILASGESTTIKPTCDLLFEYFDDAGSSHINLITDLFGSKNETGDAQVFHSSDAGAAGVYGYILFQRPVRIISISDNYIKSIYPILNSAENRMSDAELEAALIDFTYVKDEEGMYHITGWKGTLNGENSNIMELPDSNRIMI